MTDTVDLHEPISEICRRLDLNPATVRELTIRARDATAEVFLERDAAKFVDETTGDAASEFHHFTIKT